MPQWRIASRAEISPTLLSLWVHGHRKPQLDAARRVAAVLAVEVSGLWPDLATQCASENEDAPGWATCSFLALGPRVRGYRR